MLLGPDVRVDFLEIVQKKLHIVGDPRKLVLLDDFVSCVSFFAKGF